MADTKDGKVNKSQAIRDYLKSYPNAKAKEIIQGLGQQGIIVSEALVNNVKFRMQAGSKSKSQGNTNKKSVARKKRAGRGGGINKSQAIRDYLDDHPGATPTEIRDGLQRQGIEVTSGLISMVKYSGGGNKSTKKAGRPAAGRSVGGSAARALSAKDLFEAKKLVDRLGDADKVREALDALEQLR